MKSKEQIINDSIKLETPPEDYNLLEIHSFLALKQLLIMLILFPWILNWIPVQK